MSRIVPLPTTNTVVDNMVAIINADGSVASFARVPTLALPATAVFNYDIGGFAFATGIGYGLTTVAADNGATAPAAGAILGLNVVHA